MDRKDFQAHASAVLVLFQKQKKFSAKTFTKATWETALNHLEREIKEIKVADFEQKPHADMMLEYADAFILLVDSFWRRFPDLDIFDLLVAVDCKININMSREWGEPDAAGVVEHVREEKKSPFVPCDLCVSPGLCIATSSGCRHATIANTMRNIRIEPTRATLNKIENGEFTRADGDCICPACNAPYKLHPTIKGYDWLNYICDGLLVKL